MNFAETKETIARIVADERADPLIDPLGVTTVLDHGKATDRAIVLFHGFTNCPYQYRILGKMFFERGYNVYIPRVLRGGYRDRMTTEMAGLTLAEVKQSSLGAVAIAEGLGASVDVFGLSVGAVMAAWVAQSRKVSTMMALAPFFALPFVPAQLGAPVAQALLLLPNWFMWWDPRVKDKMGPPYAYPRFPTHALAVCLQLGQSVSAMARQVPPLAGRCILIVNPGDPAVSNAASFDVWNRWEGRAPALEEITLSGVPKQHDIIDPTNYPAAATVVYPRLIELMGPG